MDVESKGLRIDIRILNPHNDKELWVDQTIRHTTCHSYIKRELARVKQLRIDEKKAIALGVKFDRAASLPAIIAAAITEKNTKYARLIRTAERQMAAGKREKVPLFLAAAMSSTGFFSPQVVALQEFSVETLSFSIANGTIPLLGFTKAELLSRFRRRFRSQILCTLAKGNARIIGAAGSPFSPRS